MQDLGPFLLGSHKGGYGTVRKDESNPGAVARLVLENPLQSTGDRKIAR